MFNQQRFHYRLEIIVTPAPELTQIWNNNGPKTDNMGRRSLVFAEAQHSLWEIVSHQLYLQTLTNIVRLLGELSDHEIIWVHDNSVHPNINMAKPRISLERKESVICSYLLRWCDVIRIVKLC